MVPREIIQRSFSAPTLFSVAGFFIAPYVGLPVAVGLAPLALSTAIGYLVTNPLLPLSVRNMDNNLMMAVLSATLSLASAAVGAFIFGFAMLPLVKINALGMMAGFALVLGVSLLEKALEDSNNIYRARAQSVYSTYW